MARPKKSKHEVSTSAIVALKRARSTKGTSIVKLPVISIREFAGRFANGVRVSQQPFTWFLGAGCSKSSGILDAGGLVEKWTKELFELQGHSAETFDAWISKEFPSFVSKSPSLSYAELFSRRHPSPVERQREIEMICSRGEPAYGYATLAQLLSNKDYGRFCNTVLTTNFDDLIADALYLYGERNARPLVVTHEALARYVRTNSPRPTVVKLHGDAHLDPKNLQPETRGIDLALAKQLYPFLQDHALIFAGYGGNDESILKFVQECPIPALAPPIYWVSKQDPPEPFARWLQQRNALRVDHMDFDQLMHLIRNSLGIELLDRNRWNQIGDTYYEAFERLRYQIDNINASKEDTEALKAATSETAKSLPDDWSYYQHARQLADTDKVEAEKIFREGLDRFPDSLVLMGNFAILLDEKNDFEAAESYYKKVLEIDPQRALTLGNYALFLEKRRLDMDGAEALYKRSIDINPKLPGVLGKYAAFLLLVRKDFDAAETYYKRSIEVDPRHSVNLGNYAAFLEQNRADMDGAEVFYKRSIEADPENAIHLGYYADFLEKIRGDFDNAERLYQRALKADPRQLFSLGRYANFLEQIRNDSKLADEYRSRANASQSN